MQHAEAVNRAVRKVGQKLGQITIFEHTDPIENMGKKMSKRALEGFNSRSRYKKETENQRIIQNNSLVGQKLGQKVHKTIHLEFKKSKAITLPSYKPAKLYQGPKHWYVFYYYLQPGTLQYKRFREYFDINRIQNLSQRKAYGEEIIKFLNGKLATGFNPFEAVKSSDITAGASITQQINTVYNILCRGQSKSAILTYTTMRNRFLKFIENELLHSLIMYQIDIDTANRFKTFLTSEGLSKKTINTTLSHVALFWDKGIENKMASANPFRLVTKIKKDARSEDADIYEPLTFEELKAVYNRLVNSDDKNYWRFLALIYWAWARPVEICRLTVGQVDIAQGFIKFKKGKTKNDRGAYVQIIPQLKKVILEMSLEKYPEDYFLFSENFLPGPAPIYFKRPGKLWDRIIKKELQINKVMYALKHTGNIEYLLQNKGNTDLKWQQSQNRHSTSAMTDRYNRKLGAYFIEIGSINFRELK